MRVSLVQLAATLDPQENLETVARLVRQSAGGDASSAGVEAAADQPWLVVLPEATMLDFGPPELPLGPVAQSLDGPFVTGLVALASEVGATVVAGMFETSDDPRRPFNTLVVVSPSGELLATYRKTYLYDSFGYRESDRLRAGGGRPIVMPIGRLHLGLMTCYDLRFPEFGRALVDAGADTLVVPAAWVRGPAKSEQWSTLLRARAIENTVYVLGAGQCGRQYVGASQIIDPMGRVLAELGQDEGVLSTAVERRVIEEARRRNPSLANRRHLPVG